MIEEAERAVAEPVVDEHEEIQERVARGESYIDNEGNEVIVDLEPDFPERPGDYLTDEDSKKKTYMTKDEDGNILVKSR